MVSSSVILTGYNDPAAVRHTLPTLLQGNVDRVVVAYEGDVAPSEFLDLQDPRVTTSYSRVRLGKARAYNRAMELLPPSEVVFLVDSDLSFPPTLIEAALQEFQDPSVGVVVPHVVPTNVRGVVTRMARTIWDLHDTQLEMLSGSREHIHGGMFLAVRGALLGPFPEEIVNEDAYLCIQAARRGFRVRYRRDLLFANTVPATWRDFVRQRRRINFGHFQLTQDGMRPKVVSRMFPGQTRQALAILRAFLLRYPEDAPYLPLAAVMEVYTNVLGRIDLIDRKDHSRWEMVRRAVPLPVEAVQKVSR